MGFDYAKFRYFLQSRKASFLFISNLFFSIFFAQNETMNKFNLFNQGGQKKPTPKKLRGKRGKKIWGGPGTAYVPRQDSK